MTTNHLPCIFAHFAHGCPVRSEPISNYGLWVSPSLHGFLERLQSRRFVPFLGDIALKYFPFMTNCTPKIVLNAVDLHKHLVQVPPPKRTLMHVSCSWLSNLSSKQGTESVNPKMDTFKTNNPASLMKQGFNIAKRQWKPYPEIGPQRLCPICGYQRPNWQRKGVV